MRLFNYEGYEVRVAPEALTLKPFKKIWERDKSKTKDTALQELAFVYFYCDPRSDYQYIIDNNDRMEAVKEGEGLPSNWKPDKDLEAAIQLYSSFDSSAALLLKSANEAVEKVRKLLKELEPDDTKSLKDYLTALKMIPEVAAMLKDAEKAINEENEYGEAKGAIEKTLFDDGLDNI